MAEPEAGRIPPSVATAVAQPVAGRMVAAYQHFAARSVSHAAVGLVGVAVVAYALCLAAAACGRYDRYAASYDLGIYSQGMWLLSRGEVPFVTLRGLHLFGDHFTPVLLLLTPLYGIWSTPKTLLLVQSAALAAGAFPVYALALRRLESPVLALLCSGAYLLYPALQWTTLFDFHPDVLVTPLLLGALSFAEHRRWRGYWICALLALGTKESAALAVMSVGAFAWSRNWKHGALTVLSSGAALALGLLTIRHFNGGAPSPYFELYEAYGRDLPSIVWRLISDPRVIWARMSEEGSQLYMIQLLAPVMFLSLAAPELLLLAAPGVLSALLSNRLGMHTIYLHYTASITPFIFAAAIVGLGRLKAWGSAPSTVVIALFLAAFALDGMKWGPLHTRVSPLTRELSEDRAAAIDQMLARIPPKASVTAQVVLTPHLTNRRRLYVFPNPFYETCWGASARALRQQRGEDYPPCAREELARRIAASEVAYIVLAPGTPSFPLTHNYPFFASTVVQSREYGIIDIDRDCVVLARGADHHRGLRALEQAAGMTIDGPGDVGRAFLAWAKL